MATICKKPRKYHKTQGLGRTLHHSRGVGQQIVAYLLSYMSASTILRPSSVEELPVRCNAPTMNFLKTICSTDCQHHSWHPEAEWNACCMSIGAARVEWCGYPGWYYASQPFISVSVPSPESCNCQSVLGWVCSLTEDLCPLRFKILAFGILQIFRESECDHQWHVCNTYITDSGCNKGATAVHAHCESWLATWPLAALIQ